MERVAKAQTLNQWPAVLSNTATTTLSTAATYPLALIVTRLQLQSQLQKDRQQHRERVLSEASRSPGHDEAWSAVDDNDPEYTSIVDAARKIYSEEGGLRAFYSGFSEACGKTAADSVLFGLIYSVLHQQGLKSKPHSKPSLSTFDELAIGLVSELLSSLVTTPLSVVMTHKQVEGILYEGNNKNKASSREIVSRIVEKDGLRGLWSGYSASCLLAFSPSLAYALSWALSKTTTPNHIGHGVVSHVKKHTSTAYVFSAFVGRVASSMAMYPIHVAKARAHLKTTGMPVIRTLIDIAKTDGMKALYAGLAGEFVRGLITYGVAAFVEGIVYAAVIKGYRRLIEMRDYFYPIILAFRGRRSPPSDKGAVGQSASFFGVAKHQVSSMPHHIKEEIAYFSHLLANGAQKASNCTAVLLMGISNIGHSHSWMPTPVPPCNIPGHHHMCDCKNEELAEMIHDYVDDDVEDWRSLYTDNWI